MTHAARRQVAAGDWAGQLQAGASSCAAALRWRPPAHWLDESTAGAAGALRPVSLPEPQRLM